MSLWDPPEPGILGTCLAVPHKSCTMSAEHSRTADRAAAAGDTTTREPRIAGAEAAAQDSLYASFGELLRMLVPRADVINIYDADGNPLWSSRDSRDAPELDQMVRDRLHELPREPVAAQPAADGTGATFADDDDAAATAAPPERPGGWMERTSGGDVIYLTPLWAPNAARLGLIAVLLENFDAEPRPYSLFSALIRPVVTALSNTLELLARSMQDSAPDNETVSARDAAAYDPNGVQDDTRSRATDSQAEADGARVRRDMELIARVLDDATAEDDPGGAIERLLASAAMHFSGEMAALVVPTKGVDLRRRADGSLPPVDEMLERTRRNLIAMAGLNGRPFMINRLPRQPRTGEDQPPPYRILAAPVVDRSGGVDGVLSVFRPPTGPEFDEADLQLLALLARRAGAMLRVRHDPLTGALTRPAFTHTGEALLRSSDSVAAHALLCIDLDRMHVINDRLGHEAGDEVLVRTTAVLRAQLGPRDLLARVAGDSFALLLADCDLDAARSRAEVVLADIRKLNFVRDDDAIRVTASIGAAPLPISHDALAEALAAAEVACKAAKDRGRDRIECYLEDDHSIIRRHRDIGVLARLQNALGGDGLQLYAQPIHDLAGHRLHGLEILVRLIDDETGTVTPGSFLPAAERYQLMPALDRWVLERIYTLLEPHAALLERLGLNLFINLSGQSLGDAAFIDQLVERVERGTLPASCLTFEITESAAVVRLDRARWLIERLRPLGCRFALDDFGTGLSSFAYLQSLPVQILKIDGGFIRALEDGRVATAVVTAITGVARAMALQTVAESVETEALRTRVHGLGVDLAQGHLLGAPRPLDELIAELAGH